MQIIRRGLGQYLQMVFQVVGQKPQAPGGQGVKGRLPRQLQGSQGVFQDGEGVAPAHLAGAWKCPTDLRPLGLQHQKGVPAHEGIAGTVQFAAAQEQHGIGAPADGAEEVRQVLHPRRRRKRPHLDIGDSAEPNIEGGSGGNHFPRPLLGFPVHPLDGAGNRAGGRFGYFHVSVFVFLLRAGTVGPRRFPKTPPNHYPAPRAKNSPPVAGRSR